MTGAVEDGATRQINTEDGTPVGRTVVALLVFGVAVYAALEMRSFPPTGQFVPRVIIYPLVLLSGINLVREALDWRRYASQKDPFAGPTVAKLLEEFAALGWVLGYAVLLFTVGFTLASLVFMIAFLRIYGREPWRLVLILTAVMLGLTYGVFHRFVGFQLYEGLLGPYLPF